MPRRFLPTLLGGRSGSPSRPRGAQTETKALFDSYVQALAMSGGGVGNRSKPWPIERAMAEGYERVVWVFRCVEVISGSGSRLRTIIEKSRADGTAGRVEDHPLLDVLNGRANPLETGPQFRKRLIAQILLSKRGAFVEVTRTVGGRIIRLDLLPPGRTEIIPSFRPGELISHYDVRDIYGQVRRVDPDRVLWFRNPHPTDPFSGVTPLESAGLSIELDHFARLYNASFMMNDGRPGGILAVKGAKNDSGAMSDTEMDRIEARFGKGPVEAGKLTVLSGELSFVDTAAKPRDTQYPVLSSTAKAEILGSFGVPLSKLGDASGRTFSNADAEDDHFWLTDPMPTMLSILSTGFDDDADDDQTVGWDMDDIPPVQRAQAAKREEARAEVAAGLRSIESYADLAGIEGLESTAMTRALWMPQGRTPIPATAEDAQELGVGQPDDSAPPADAPPAVEGGEQPGQLEAGPAAGQAALPAGPGDAAGSPGGAPSGRTVAQIVAAAQGAAQGPSALPAGPPPQTKAAQLGVATAAGVRPPRRTRARVTVRRREPTTRTAASREDVDDLAEALGDVIASATAKNVARSLARLQSPKARKGTPHFTPEHKVDNRVGTKALDTSRAVDPDRWAQDAQDAVRERVEAAAQQHAQRVADDLAEDDELSPGAKAAIAAAVTAAVLAMAADAAAGQARRMADALNQADQDGLSFAAILSTGRRIGQRIKSWARQLGTTLAVATIESASTATVDDLVNRGVLDPARIRRIWVSKRDGNVRPTHVLADEQTVSWGSPFVVGRALLRFPGDPLGPPEETINCRCRVQVSYAAEAVRLTS